MKKEYPVRESNPPFWYDDICKCGDEWRWHDISGWKNFLFWWSNDITKSMGKCSTCQCPGYKLDWNNLSDRRIRHIFKNVEGTPVRTTHKAMSGPKTPRPTKEPPHE